SILVEVLYSSFDPYIHGRIRDPKFTINNVSFYSQNAYEGLYEVGKPKSRKIIFVSSVVNAVR
ncbi:hypothetical protein BN1723_009738, partial [Verticillium longisporum]